MHSAIASSSADSRHVGWWLLLAGASAALILYGSLFPFRLRTDVDLGFFEAIRTLQVKPTTRGDVVANLLLYAPLGLCLTFAAGRGGFALVRTVALGTALSFAVELMQVYLRFRVASLTDVALNAIGTFGGACAAIAYGALGVSLNVSVFASRRPDPAALSVALLWLAFRLAPFVPTVDWQKYKDALKPLLLNPQVSALDVFRFSVGWLVVGYAVRLLARREHVVPVTLAMAVLVLIGRVVVVGKALSPSELVALVACIPLGALLISLRERRVAVLAALAAAVVVAQGVTPLEWLQHPQVFSWIPFRSSLRGSLETNYSALLEKAFWYFSLVWLLTQWRLRPAAAAIATACVLAAIEVVQMWLPGRSADVTDPLLALAAGVLLSIPREASFAAAGRSALR